MFLLDLELLLQKQIGVDFNFTCVQEELLRVKCRPFALIHSGWEEGDLVSRPDPAQITAPGLRPLLGETVGPVQE